jgi:hypothetical protein
MLPKLASTFLSLLLTGYGAAFNSSSASQIMPSPSAIDLPATPLPSDWLAARKTVADYFLEIPRQYLKLTEGDSISGIDRQKLLTEAKQGKRGGIYDLNNGYLKLIRGGDLCPSYEVAIFNRPQASPLVALNISCTIGDDVKIFDPDRGWEIVTKSVLPVNLSPDPNLAYTVTVVLPRVGRTIEVYHEGDRKTLVGRYGFNGQQFVKQ